VPDLWVLLSWDSSASPLYRLVYERPLPARRCRLAFGESLPGDPSCSAFAVSHRPDGFLRSCLAGLLRPAAGSRFIAFQPLVLRSRRPGRVRTSPRCALPLEGFSSSVAVPHHCGRCPPAVLRSLVSSTRVSRRSGSDTRSYHIDSRCMIGSPVVQRVLRSLRRSGFPALRAGRGRGGRASASFRVAGSCLQASPSSAGPLAFACGPRRPPARRTSFVPAEAGAPGVATPLRSSLALGDQASNGRAFRGRHRLGFPPFLARPFLPLRAGRSGLGPGAQAPGRWVPRTFGFPLRFVLCDSWGWGAGTCSGSNSSAILLPCGRGALPFRAGRGRWLRSSLLPGSFEPFGSASLGLPREARVLRSGIGGGDFSLLRGRVRGRAVSGRSPRARSHRLQGFHPPASP